VADAARRPRPTPPVTADEVVRAHRPRSLRELLLVVGPGIITGGADNDPAGIATYSVVGAGSGFSQNWLLLLSTPLLITVQSMSARVGNVLKTDLATAIRNRFGRRVATPAVLLAVVANLLTIGADLLMMAAVTELVTGIRYLYFVVPYAALMAAIMIFTDYKVVSKYLLWLVGVFACYIVAAFMAIVFAQSALVAHDLAHRQIFRTRRLSQGAGLVAGVVLLTTTGPRTPVSAGVDGAASGSAGGHVRSG